MDVPLRSVLLDPGVNNIAKARTQSELRQRLYRQNQVEIEVYKKEIGALAAREDEQRRILKELWSQKAALQAKDEKYTQIVWEVRKHVLEHKDELEKLEKLESLANEERKRRKNR